LEKITNPLAKLPCPGVHDAYQSHNIYSGGEHMSKMSMLSPSKSLDIATSKKLQEKPLEVP
jgi:hypothetical protein